jgi:hypothetical protein
MRLLIGLFRFLDVKQGMRLIQYRLSCLGGVIRNRSFAALYSIIMIGDRELYMHHNK